jgi:hypothetical protein
MAEKHMIQGVQAALDHLGIDDRIIEVGQFMPRGSTGSMFAGGLIGGEIGDAIGGVGGAVGTAAGALGGIRANADASGLSRMLLVGVSASTVYGFAMPPGGRRKEPHELLFQLPREGLEVKVHARVNVRILELIQTNTGSKIELEGNRLPITHSHDLIKFLAGEQAVADADTASKAAGEADEPR